MDMPPRSANAWNLYASGATNFPMRSQLFQKRPANGAPPKLAWEFSHLFGNGAPDLKAMGTQIIGRLPCRGIFESSNVSWGTFAKIAPTTPDWSTPPPPYNVGVGIERQHRSFRKDTALPATLWRNCVGQSREPHIAAIIAVPAPSPQQGSCGPCCTRNLLRRTGLAGRRWSCAGLCRPLAEPSR